MDYSLSSNSGFITNHRVLCFHLRGKIYVVELIDILINYITIETCMQIFNYIEWNESSV